MNLGRMPFRVCGPFLLALLLGACGTGTAPSAEDNRQLDNAADMLDAAPEALGNIDSNSLLNPPDSNTSDAAPPSR